MLQAIKEIAHKDGVAVFVSSHILAEMQQMCDKVAVLDNGKIVKVEEISETKEEATEHVELRVKNINKTIKILKEKFNLEAKTEKDAINILLPTENLPKVVKELAISDVEIKAVIPKSHTLEDIFFDATEKEKNKK